MSRARLPHRPRLCQIGSPGNLVLYWDGARALADVGLVPEATSSGS
jgi:hypothetical protein